MSTDPLSRLRALERDRHLLLRAWEAWDALETHTGEPAADVARTEVYRAAFHLFGAALTAVNAAQGALLAEVGMEDGQVADVLLRVGEGTETRTVGIDTRLWKVVQKRAEASSRSFRAVLEEALVTCFRPHWWGNKTNRQHACQNGHPLVEGNVIYDARRGKRKCRTCQLERQRLWARRQRAAQKEAVR